jgi:hypothetical protein
MLADDFFGQVGEAVEEAVEKDPKIHLLPKEVSQICCEQKKESVSTANCTRPETNLLPQHKAASEFIPLGGLTNSVARSRNPKQTKSFH